MIRRAIEPMTPDNHVPADQADVAVLPITSLPADPPATDRMSPLQAMPAARVVVLPKTDMPPAGQTRSDPQPIDPGHCSNEAQGSSAGPAEAAEDVLVSTEAQAHSDSEPGHLYLDPLRRYAGPDLDRLHALLGHYARQFFALQKLRVGQGNRIAAMERDGLGDVWTAPARDTTDGLEALEKAVDRQLTRLAKQHPLAPWIAAQRGVGIPTMARLLGITGPLSRFGTVSKLWAYLGMHVVDGAAPKRRKGEKANWSPQGRVLCYLLGEAIVKAGSGPYRAAYDRKKAEYETDRPEWPQIRRHNAAKRYAVKLMLKQLWIEWHRLTTTAPTVTPGRPSPLDGHKDKAPNA